MPRYIDTDKIRLTIPTCVDDEGDVYVLLSDVRRAIAQTPTEDVVAVVRCKDCIHRFKDAEGDYCCNLDDCYAGDTGFCSYGKRR